MKVTLAEAAAILRRKAQEIERRLKIAEEQNAQEALTVARAYSSGPFSSKELAVMGHPYARRAPRPPGNPAVLNRQTGRFRAGWRIVHVGDTWKVVNNSKLLPYFSQGTAVMIRRPIVRAIAQTLRRSRERRLARALKDGLEAR